MYRTGIGYDSHRFAEGKPLVLGGLRIDYPLGLSGHSDADVVLHALTDAVLGAAAAGDIGRLFPDNDERYRNADSSIFLKHAITLAKQKGYRIGNCDVTILAQQPRIAPHAEAMRQNIAKLMDMDMDGVSVKAKTNEGMGFIGRGEGIAAFAVATLIKKQTE